jgi:hypothetical protein
MNPVTIIYTWAKDRRLVTDSRGVVVLVKILIITLDTRKLLVTSHKDIKSWIHGNGYVQIEQRGASDNTEHRL